MGARPAAIRGDSNSVHSVMCVYACVYMYVCICMCVYACVYMYVCICMCVYVCVCTHSSSLAWRIPWTVKPGWRGGYSSWGLTELDTIEAT